MTDAEQRMYQILEFLNRNYVRTNSTLTKEILRMQFDFTESDFDDAFHEIHVKDYIYFREASPYIAISPDGERKLDQLQKKLNLTQRENKVAKQKPHLINRWQTVLALLGTIFAAGFWAGYYVGTVKYDKEKIELERRVDQLNKEKSQLEEQDSNEIRSMKIDAKNYLDTFQKQRAEIDSLTRVIEKLRPRRK